MPPRRRSVTPHQLPLTFGAPSRRSSWASAELPDARVYGGAPVEPFPLTAGLVDGFRQEFSRSVEAVLDAADIGAARRASEHMKRLGAAWRTFTVTWLTHGLEEALGYARARSVRTKLTVPAWTWEAPFHPMLSEVQAFAVFVRDRQAWAREAIKATAQPFDALNTLATAHRITLYRPRVQRASIGRLSIGIAPMPDEIARAALGRVGEALRALDEQRRVPWLPARLPPITLVNECLYVGGIRFNGGYDPRLRTVDICASWAATEESVREIAMTIAHESGHHIWRTVLSGDAQAEWTDAINRPVMVRAADIAAAWRPGESADAFIERVSETDPVMALRLGGEMSFGTLAGWERGHFAAMGPKAVVRLSANPVTIYGAKSPEEAFCEALGLLAAYGPRTVLPEVAAILQTIVPTVRPKSNDLIEHMALHTGIETVMEAEERDEHAAHARHLRQRRRHKRNSARAERRREREVDGRRETVIVPASLSRGHFRQADVQRDTRIAERTRERSFLYDTASGERVYGRSELLGSGNFGIGYRVDDDGGARVVKVPAAIDIQNRVWTREGQTRNFRHEAGVANELAALGYSIIPRTTYVEFGRGTPALVRDYGLPAGPLSVEEYAELERQLFDIERRHGWGVHDDLAIYRRHDGSVFVGDVGFWTAPRPRVKGKRRVWDAFLSDLDHLLSKVREEHGVPHDAALYHIIRDAKRVLRLREFDTLDSFDRRLVADFIATVRDREALGLATPAEFAPAVAIATKFASA